MDMIKKLGMMALMSSALSAYAAFDTTPPSSGVLDSASNGYRNLFAEIGKSQSSIDSKVNTAYNKMMAGSSNEKLYYTFDSNEAYIKDIGSNDVRSEGMSWGMTIAVMKGDKGRFDKLWRFMHDRMKQSGGNYPGTFAWHVSTGGNVLDSNPAPDGELYAAFALFNAHARWGSASSGVLDYEQKANDILNAMKNHLMDSSWKQIVFSPVGDSADFTDTSYHIPAFYEYFADVASSNNAYWNDAAAASRTFLENHFNYTSHGLATYLAEFNGDPKTGNVNGKPADIYEEDAWRVIMNVGLDAHLSGAKTWHKNAVNDLQTYFRSSTAKSNGCNNQFAQRYKKNGSHYGTCGSNNYSHDQGQKATMAVGSFAATNTTRATDFLNRLWNDSFPTGTWRYYSGTLHMLGMLHASGKFKLYYPSGGGSSSSSSSGGGSTSSSGGVPTAGQNNLKFVNQQYGKCLQASGSSNNGYVNINTCDGGSDQSLDMKSLSGHIRIDFDNSNQSVDAGSTSNGNRVRTYQESSHNNRRIQFIASGSHFQIKSVTSGKCIEATSTQTKWQNCNSSNNKQLWSTSGGGGGGSSSCLNYTYGSGLKNLEFTSNSGGCVNIVGGNIQSSSNFYIGKQTGASCTMYGTATGNSGGSKNINSGWVNMTGSLNGNKMTVAVSNGCKKFRMRVMP